MNDDNMKDFREKKDFLIYVINRKNRIYIPRDFIPERYKRQEYIIDRVIIK